MSHFDRAFALTVGHEGGLVDHPSDPGGLTKFGITKRDFPALDIPNLTLDEARELYLEHYWTAAGLDRVGDGEIACKMFDMGVNMGARRMTIVVQQAINYLLRRGDELEVDGILGPLTVEAVNGAEPRDLFLALKGEHYVWYRTLIAKNENLEPFARGWLRRALG